MKIAVLHNGGSVGGWKWICAVFGAIKKYYPETEITIFCQKNVTCPKNIADIMNTIGLKIYSNFNFSGFNYKEKKFFHIKLFDNIINLIRKNKKKIKSIKQLNMINSYDIIFNSWPYTSNAIEVTPPHFFIPHDFIFRHYFGHHVGNVYNRKWWREMKNKLKEYLDNGYIPCVTTNYIASELQNTFPEYKGDIHKVLIVWKNNSEYLSSDEISEVMNKFEIKNDYILLATNDMHHKNTQAALSSFYYIKQKYPELKLIIVGYGTEDVRAKVNCPYYADHVEDDEDYDVKSLGLVSDLEINALIQNAKLLLNVSLCEAACGSGLDAWFLGTPTAISDIPPYKEHVETLGIKTEFFNPKNSQDIAASVLRLLDNPEYAQENAKISKETLNTKYTEKDMANNYMAVFEKYIKKGQE